MNPSDLPHGGMLRALALAADGPQFKVFILALPLNLLRDLGQVVLPL